MSGLGFCRRGHVGDPSGSRSYRLSSARTEGPDNSRASRSAAPRFRRLDRAGPTGGPADCHPVRMSNARILIVLPTADVSTSRHRILQEAIR